MIGQSREVHFYFLDLVSFDPEELGAAPFAAVVSGPLVANEGFVAFFEKLVDLKRFNVLAVRPAPLEIGRPIDVIVERTGEGEVVAQYVFYRLPIVCFVSGITAANQIGYDAVRFHIDISHAELSLVVRIPQFLDVELAHLQHRLHGVFCFLRIFVLQHIAQAGGNDLP
jgi:hypothetical protein